MMAQQRLSHGIEGVVRRAKTDGLTLALIASCLIYAARALMRSHVGDAKIIELFPTSER
jgi:hypothetical protein